MTTAAVILAAGESRRMGRVKALLELGGETFLDRLIRLAGSACDGVVVVVGYHQEAIRRGCARLGEVRVAVNPAPEKGQLSSLQAGLRALAPEGHWPDAVLLAPMDFPSVRGVTLHALMRAFQEANPQPPMAVPCFQRGHGHPVLLSAAVAREMEALPAEATARDVTRRYRDSALYLETGDAGVCRDIDTPEDYERLLASWVAGQDGA